eukprot:CAMPEP_0185774626 /NCGR_PEP_ID=MMETSP1174-20130828/79124_1 /TAXON_ID=35687 /ORGANISM="Dictyocha speculum, Strain CCMP1381" /LENGTH=136 /DNA_ID=CAMNT_0028461897 /DNA_START=1 /DNA_END=411 /DNA_ORIENTATION=+
MGSEASAYASSARTGESIMRANALHDNDDSPSPPLTFGPYVLSPSQQFYISPSGLSVGFVNLKPLVPGHVLVIPRRNVPKLVDLTEEELVDLWSSVMEVRSIVLRFHGCAGAEIGVQDGADAGQSVPHVHVHILPR